MFYLLSILFLLAALMQLHFHNWIIALWFGICSLISYGLAKLIANFFNRHTTKKN